MGRTQEVELGNPEVDLETRIERSLKMIDHIVNIHEPSHVFALVSGGHDSIVNAHVTSRHPAFSGVAHINTQTGIRQTTEYVKRVCNDQDWNYVELVPDVGEEKDKTYEEMVRELGFPHGPKSHNRMYYYLKERPVARLVREHKTHWFDRIGLSTGVRKSESNRRMQSSISVPMRRNGARLWINPILYWSKAETSAYIEHVGLPRNEVVDTIHKSGECLCGALANPNELEEIEFWYPEAAAPIRELERELEEKGYVDCRWAQSNAPGKTWDEVDFDPEDVNLQMCVSCVNKNQAANDG